MTESKIDFHTYFMAIAFTVSSRADCNGRKVGAVLVKDDRILSTGYNGTPEGMKNCTEGGCYRCENRGRIFKSGEAYDKCICVHAEQNALLTAARFGISVEGSSIYTTHQPCFGCAKELLQAKIREIHYVYPWDPPGNLHAQYGAILDKFKEATRVKPEKFKTIQALFGKLCAKTDPLV